MRGDGQCTGQKADLVWGSQGKVHEEQWGRSCTRSWRLGRDLVPSVYCHWLALLELALCKGRRLLWHLVAETGSRL